jgi:hypothetical protein
MALLDRRGFSCLLLGTVAAMSVPPGLGHGAADDPPVPLRTVRVRNSNQLDKALADAQPGDQIVLADGTLYLVAASGRS